MKNAFIIICVFILFISGVKYSESLTEELRPLIHFSPQKGWMNDPNGLIYLDGEYHLFYQYNPDTTVWGPMHWGHAVSRDLIHWQHLPIALFPDSLGTIFSGSCVYDENNSSGLGTNENPPLVAIFTHHGGLFSKPGREGLEEQSLAYSTDKGSKWTKYKGNPVLLSMNKDFRDPKVMWHEPSQKWVMTLAAGNKIMFFNSPDLINWTLTGTFNSTDTTLGVYECPDLFSLQIPGKPNETKWVLLTSYGSGTPNGNCGTSYIVGDFDGKTFTTNDAKPSWFDYGADNYAGVTFSNIPSSDGRRLFIGWMSNWSYADIVPATSRRGNMTLPRELTLVENNGKYTLHTFPVKELKKLYGDSVKHTFSEFNKTKNLESLQSGCFVVDFVINIPVDSFTIKLSNTLNEYLNLSYKSENLTINRKFSGKEKISDYFEEDQSMPIKKSFPLKLYIVYDITALEIFANDGEASMSEMVFPEMPYNRIEISGLNNQNVESLITVYKLIK